MRAKARMNSTGLSVRTAAGSEMRYQRFRALRLSGSRKPSGLASSLMALVHFRYQAWNF